VEQNRVAGHNGVLASFSAASDDKEQHLEKLSLHIAMQTYQ
jgi:hypothetical protein